MPRQTSRENKQCRGEGQNERLPKSCCRRHGANEFRVSNRLRSCDHQAGWSVPTPRQSCLDATRHIGLMDRLHEETTAAGQRHHRQAPQQPGQTLHVVFALRAVDHRRVQHDPGSAGSQKSRLPSQHAITVGIRPSGEFACAAEPGQSANSGATVRIAGVCRACAQETARVTSASASRKAFWSRRSARRAPPGSLAAAHFSGFRTIGTTGTPSASKPRHSASPDLPVAPIT